MFIFLLVLIVNTVVCFLYILIEYPGKKEAAICRGSIAAIIPVFGILFFLISDIIVKLDKKNNEYSKGNMILNKKKMEFLQRSDYEQEINLVPLEETLIIGNNEERRKMLLNILKKDMDRYISVIAGALENKDTETSHYAASAVTEISRKFALSLQRMAVEYERKNDNYEIARMYAEEISKFIRSGLLEEKEIKKYMYLYAQVMENMISSNRDISTDSDYYEFVNLLIEIQEYEKGEKWCLRFFDEFPNSEGAYVCLMKLYYATGRRKEFYKTMQQLKNSDIPLSHKGLNIVRFWSAG